MTYYTKYFSPLGEILLLSDGESLTGLYLEGQSGNTGDIREEIPIFDKARRWLDAYFRGENPSIDFPLEPHGTIFQKQVWKLLLAIPYGHTRTYGDIAREITYLCGKEKMSAQAVGQAVGRNPISIIVPCHRVVGAKGQLTGYAGGLEKKSGC